MYLKGQTRKAEERLKQDVTSLIQIIPNSILTHSRSWNNLKAQDCSWLSESPAVLICFLQWGQAKWEPLGRRSLQIKMTLQGQMVFGWRSQRFGNQSCTVTKEEAEEIFSLKPPGQGWWLFVCICSHTTDFLWKMWFPWPSFFRVGLMNCLFQSYLDHLLKCTFQVSPQVPWFCVSAGRISFSRKYSSWLFVLRSLKTTAEA